MVETSWTKTKDTGAIRRRMLDRKEEDKSGKAHRAVEKKGTKKRYLIYLKSHGSFFEESVLGLDLKRRVGISHI